MTKLKTINEIKKINILLILAVLILILNLIILTALLSGKSIILVEYKNQSCKSNLIDTSWKIQDNISFKDFCYYPPECYDTQDEFLNQFDNQTMPSIICYYAIYCSGRTKWWKSIYEK